MVRLRSPGVSAKIGPRPRSLFIPSPLAKQPGGEPKQQPDGFALPIGSCPTIPDHAHSNSISISEDGHYCTAALPRTENGVAERFVGNCRLDLLDHVIVLIRLADRSTTISPLKLRHHKALGFR